MTVAFLDLARQAELLHDDLECAVREVFASGRFVLGPRVAKFEREFADVCGTAECVGVASGSDALALALRAGGVSAGDEVLVPAFTALATVAAVASIGACPVLVDVERDTLTLDPACLDDALSDRTRAVVAVHLYGQCADMDGVMAFADRNGVLAVEDCAQAAGSLYRGRPAGSLGHAAAFSFYATKNLGAVGDAGAVTTNDRAIADRVRLLRNHGMDSDGRALERSTHSRLDELQAAILSAKLPRLETWTRRRREIAGHYLSSLAAVKQPAIMPPVAVDDRRHAFHLFVIRSPNRDSVRERLASAGVGTLVHYPLAVHQHPAYEDLGVRPGALRQSDRAAAEVISLPLYPELSDAEVAQVAEALATAAASG